MNETNDTKRTDTAKAAQDNGERNLRKIRILISVLAGLIVLGIFWRVYSLSRDTSSPEMAPYVGNYLLSSASNGEIKLDKTDSGVISLNLNADGTCRLETEDEGYAGKWSLDGENISILCGSVRLSGTISGNVITFNNISDTGIDVMFIREGSDDIAQSTPLASETPESESVPLLTGKYVPTKAEINGAGYSTAVIKILLGGEPYAIINSDGTGELYMPGSDAEAISYDAEYIHYQGMLISYTVDGTAVTLQYSDSVTIYVEKEDA